MIVEAKLILKNVTFSKNYGPLPKPKQKTSHLTGIKDIAGECKEKASAIAVNEPKKNRATYLLQEYPSFDLEDA